MSGERQHSILIPRPSHVHAALCLAHPNRVPDLSSLSFRYDICNSSFSAVVLNGTVYHNNSIVMLENIGEDDDALLCITNQTACCQPPYTGDTGDMGDALGNWYFPNGTTVLSATVNDTSSEMLDFYKSGDQRVVRMNRRRGGVDGIYCCVVPDAVNVSSTTLCIGVYSASTGKWSIMIGSYYVAYVAN